MKSTVASDPDAELDVLLERRDTLLKQRAQIDNALMGVEHSVRDICAQQKWKEFLKINWVALQRHRRTGEHYDG